MAKTIKITDDGLKKLEEELETLKTEGRADIAEKIKVARGYGDLSENSE
ncbi:MAG: transcription elongation factor GreA, partial [Clostridia bacterium]|nr:transcription elongation factor GreA [Clostridia bacterium]